MFINAAHVVLERRKEKMRKAALVLATAATLGLTSVAAPTAAEARGFGHHGFGPALAGGLIAGAVIGGLASSAYAYGPGYGYYAPAYYDGYYDDYAPVYGYRRVVRPAFAFYGGPRFYGGWHHRHHWHRYW
jgi:hypothetical protein